MAKLHSSAVAKLRLPASRPQKEESAEYCSGDGKVTTSATMLFGFQFFGTLFFAQEVPTLKQVRILSKTSFSARLNRVN